MRGFAETVSEPIEGFELTQALHQRLSQLEGDDIRFSAYPAFEFTVLTGEEAFRVSGLGLGEVAPARGYVCLVRKKDQAEAQN